MAKLLPFEVLERILVGLDIEDLIRCKSVCKSWQSLISNPDFVKAQLAHSYKTDCDNSELGHRRISCASVGNVDSWYYFNLSHIVGSCNGLVCVSPKDLELIVTNPSTREEKTLQTPPCRPNMQNIRIAREVLGWGFGYDLATDNYKAIVGFRQDKWDTHTLFYVLTLKSNTWKLIGEVNYRVYCDGRSGILCNGALHWFMLKFENLKKRKVIISLNLSTEEFKEIPLPDKEEKYKRNEDHRLGVIEQECLCIYSSVSPLSKKKWVMRNDKWELYKNNESKYDVAHRLTKLVDHYSTNQSHKTSYVYSHDGGTRVPIAGDYIRSSIFVKSLVSPHSHPRPSCINNKNERNLKQDNGSVERKRKRKRKSKRSCTHKRPLFSMFKSLVFNRSL